MYICICIINRILSAFCSVFCVSFVMQMRMRMRMQSSHLQLTSVRHLASDRNSHPCVEGAGGDSGDCGDANDSPAGRSLARRRANSDIPTGPTLAACGDAIARNVALTAPRSAAVASRLLAAAMSTVRRACEAACCAPCAECECAPVCSPAAAAAAAAVAALDVSANHGCRRS